MASAEHAALDPSAHVASARSPFQWLQRPAAVGAGCAADIVVNYPMWIVAKRMGVGMRPAVPPTFSDLYKGGGSLWVSFGPTVVLEDISKRTFEDLAGPSFLSTGVDTELISSVFAGAFAAATFCAQVEHIITAAHAQQLSMGGAISHVYRKRGGVRGILLPPGILAMMGREIPFVAALFCVRPAVTARVYGSSRSSSNSSSGAEARPPLRLHLELLAGFATSCLTSPVSHVPSVVAAYQQGHGVKLRQACSDIYRQNGWRGFFSGLLPRTLSIAGTLSIMPVVIEALGGNSSL